jgi:Ran GTPase-activating protein (RanGAP) involved in mRNA processing and transport
MPVEVASQDELMPFMKFLDSDEKIIAKTQEKSVILEDCIKFTRGALYPDGRLDLCKQVVGPDHIELLMKSLKNNSQITHFLLGNNIINYQGAKAIAEYLTTPHKSKIQTWYIAGNAIDKDGIALISKALWLKRNPLNPIGIKHISDMLKVNTTLKILDLHNTAVFDEGLIYLVEGLRLNRTLRHLYLDANAITPKSIVYLANYFKELTKKKEKGIHSLWIEINRLNDEGICILLDALKDYSYLKRLNIGSNGITYISAKKLYETFKNNKSLSVLSLGCYKSTAV